MSRAGRLVPALVAVATGVISGIYIFQPLIIEERGKQLAGATLNIQTTSLNNASPNTTPTASLGSGSSSSISSSDNARPS